LVIVTHETREKNMMAAVKQMAGLDVTRGVPVCIRIVDIPSDQEC
jgi:hypothetical protein